MAKKRQTEVKKSKETKQTELTSPPRKATQQKQIKIKEISLDSDIVACLDGKPVPSPVWEAKRPGEGNGEDTADKLGIRFYDGYGSRRPGIMVIGDKQHPGLKVTLKVDNIDRYQNPRLEGEMSFDADDMELMEAPEAMLTQATFKSVLLEKTSTSLMFHAIPDPNPQQFSRLYGNMKWTFTYDPAGDRDGIYEEETYLEIFWIYGPPGKMYKKGVWVEVLRLLDTECLGQLNQKEVMSRVVNLCFGGMGLRYDSYGGASYYVYGWRGGGFDLQSYLDKVHPLCNCYDQAGAVQTLLGALGINVTFTNLHPFGFLKKTNLVGRGEINNPFFYSGRRHGLYSGILPSNDENRGDFGEHGFCTWDNGEERVVLDACAGPFLGNHSIQEYLELTVDGLTDLYRTQKNNRPGTISDIKFHPGITDVHSLPNVGYVGDETENKTGLDDEIKKIMKTDKFKGVVLNFKDIDHIVTEFMLTDLGVPPESNFFRGGFDTAARVWSYRGANKYFFLSISVSNNIQSPLDVFRYMSSRAQLRGLNEGGLMMSIDALPPTVSFTPQYKIYSWWYYNLFIKKVGINIPKHLFKAISYNLKSYIFDQPVVDKLSKQIPDITKFTIEVYHSFPEVYAGETISINIFSPEKLKNQDQFDCEFFYAGDCLVLTGEDSNTDSNYKKRKPFKTYTFRCNKYGFTAVGIVVVDKSSLLCSEPHWEIIQVF